MMRHGLTVPLKFTARTSGDGFWSRAQKDVECVTGSLFVFENGDMRFGELQVFFREKDWKVDEDGLIYTDSGWLRGLRRELSRLGFSKGAVADVDYSEQGMQGNDYVSLDVGTPFIDEAMRKYGPDLSHLEDS